MFKCPGKSVFLALWLLCWFSVGCTSISVKDSKARLWPNPIPAKPNVVADAVRIEFERAGYAMEMLDGKTLRFTKQASFSQKLFQGAWGPADELIEIVEVRVEQVDSSAQLRYNVYLSDEPHAVWGSEFKKASKGAWNRVEAILARAIDHAIRVAEDAKPRELN